MLLLSHDAGCIGSRGVWRRRDAVQKHLQGGGHDMGGCCTLENTHHHWTVRAGRRRCASASITLAMWDLGLSPAAVLLLHCPAQGRPRRVGSAQMPGETTSTAALRDVCFSAPGRCWLQPSGPLASSIRPDARRVTPTV